MATAEGKDFSWAGHNHGEVSTDQKRFVAESQPIPIHQVNFAVIR